MPLQKRPRRILDEPPEEYQKRLDAYNKSKKSKKVKTPTPVYQSESEEEEEKSISPKLKRYIDEHDDMKVPLPHTYPKISIPELFIEKGNYETGEYEKDENGNYKTIKIKGKLEKIPILKKGWFVEKWGNETINKTRNISSRKGHKLLNLQVSKTDKIQEHNAPYPMPRLRDFPFLKDRIIVYKYLTHLDPEEIKDYPTNKPRGRPPILPTNWAYHNLGEIPKLKDYKKKKGEKSQPKYTAKDIDWGSEEGSAGGEEREPSPVSSPSSVSSSSPPPVKKGRPSKYGEHPVPKLESNRIKRKNRATLEKLETIMNVLDTYKTADKLGKVLRATYNNYYLNKSKLQELLSTFNKKEQEDYKDIIGRLQSHIEGSGVNKTLNDTLEHLISHITDPKEPIDKRDYKQSKEIIDTIQKEKSKKKSKGEGVDFEEVKWGTLTALYKRFMKQHPDFKDKIEDLDHFAHFVVANPEKFSKVANKKSHFYLNIIKKGEE